MDRPSHPGLMGAVTGALSELGYAYTVDEDVDCRFAVRIDDLDWRSQVIVYPAQRLVRHHLYLTDRCYPAWRKSWVRDLAMLLNCDAALGTLCYEADTGGVLYRRDEDFRFRSPGPRVMRRMLDACVFTVRMWRAGFAWVDFAGASPHHARDWSLLELDAYEGAGLVPSTLKPLLRVSHGIRESQDHAHPAPNLRLVHSDDLR